jgi:sulfane dehydrogenase subunit SoxC
VSVSLQELQLATRNHGMPLEALRWEVTPVGLHYLLIHYDIPRVEPASWRLRVRGERELALSLAELRGMPAVTRRVTLECAGNGRAHLDPRPVSQPWLLEAVGTAEWTGVPVRAVLDAAGIPAEAVQVVFTGHDRGVEEGEEQAYARALPLAECEDGPLLAYAVNGAPLPPQHGFPLRLVVPGWYGMTSVKWLASIELVREPFRGHQQERAYRIRSEPDDPGTPVERIHPRSLLVPPGIPDFITRARRLAAGPCTVEGRAWSGYGEIAGVEVSADGGASWAPAELGGPVPPGTWRHWTFAWEAEPGEHELCSRARDSAGHEQPVAAPWNVGGYANTSVQRVAVTVT